MHYEDTDKTMTFQDFKLEGGALKKIAPCEKISILRQKIIFFSNCGGRRENFGVFRVKNHYGFFLKKYSDSQCC